MLAQVASRERVAQRRRPPRAVYPAPCIFSHLIKHLTLVQSTARGVSQSIYLSIQYINEANSAGHRPLLCHANPCHFHNTQVPNLLFCMSPPKSTSFLKSGMALAILHDWGHVGIDTSFKSSVYNGQLHPTADHHLFTDGNGYNCGQFTELTELRASDQWPYWQSFFKWFNGSHLDTGRVIKPTLLR